MIGGDWSNAFVNYTSYGMNVVVINNTTPQQVVDQGLLTQNNCSMFVLIPQGFSENLTRHTAGEGNITGTVSMYGVFNGGGGIFSGIGSSSVTALVEGFNRAVAPDLVVASQSSIIKGQIQEGVDSSILGQL